MAAAAIGPLIGAAGQIMSAVDQQHFARWMQNTFVDRINRMQPMIDLGSRRMQETLDPAVARNQSQQEALMDLIFGSNNYLPNILSNSNELQSLIPELFGNNELFMPPGAADSQGRIQGRSDAINPVADIAQQLFAGGGWTPDRQNVMDRVFDIINGRGAAMDELQNTGSNLLGQRGQTAMTQQLTDSATQGVQSGGRTPESDQLLQLALKQSNFDQIPLHTLISMFRDQAGTANAQAAGAARRTALSRGGGPGATVANGITNQAFADFYNEAGENDARALREAVGQYEKTGLQKAGLGQGTAGNVLSSMNQRLGTFGNLGTSALNAETARLGSGGSLLDMFNRSRLLGLGIANDANTSQGQYTLGAGNLFSALQSLGGNLDNSVFNNFMYSGQLGMNRATNMSQQMLSGLGQRGNLLQSLLNFNNQTGAIGQDQTRTLLDLIRTGVSGMPGVAANNLQPTGLDWAGLSSGLTNIAGLIRRNGPPSGMENGLGF